MLSARSPTSLHTYCTFKPDISFSSPKSCLILVSICFSSLCCEASFHRPYSSNVIWSVSVHRLTQFRKSSESSYSCGELYFLSFCPRSMTRSASGCSQIISPSRADTDWYSDALSTTDTPTPILFVYAAGFFTTASADGNCAYPQIL